PCPSRHEWSCMTEPLRLFLVEDDEEVAFLTRLHLERAGYEVTVCRTGADALIVLGHSSYHLVLLDNKLPDLRALDLIQTLAREGICSTDMQGTMLHVNAALETMTGYDRQEMIGQNPRLFKSGTHEHEFYAELWRTILARHSWQGELLNRRKDGTLLDTSVTI